MSQYIMLEKNAADAIANVLCAAKAAARAAGDSEKHQQHLDDLHEVIRHAEQHSAAMPTKGYISGEGEELYARYNADTDTIEGEPCSICMRTDDLVVGNIFHIPLGYISLSHATWEAEKSRILAGIQPHIDSLREGEITPFDIDVWR